MSTLTTGGLTLLAAACGRSPLGSATIPDAAGDAASFYRGKTVRIVVGFGAGSSHDTYARVLAKSLGRYIPGAPAVSVENRPGAGSAVAWSEMATKLPRDGTVIGLGDGSLILNQLIATRAPDVDMSSWSYLGSISTVGVVYVSNQAALDRRGIQSFADHLGPQGRELVIGEAPGSTLLASRVAEFVTGARIRRSLNAAGPAQLEAALEAGEIDAYFAVWDARGGAAPTDYSEGRRTVLLICSASVLPELEQLSYRAPRLMELVTTEENRRIVEITASGLGLYHAAAVAPDVPADRVAVLQNAFQDVLQDDDVRAGASYTGIGLRPTGESGPAQKEIAQRILATPADIRARLQRISGAQDRQGA